MAMKAKFIFNGKMEKDVELSATIRDDIVLIEVGEELLKHKERYGAGSIKLIFSMSELNPEEKLKEIWWGDKFRKMLDENGFSWIYKIRFNYPRPDFAVISAAYGKEDSEIPAYLARWQYAALDKIINSFDVNSLRYAGVKTWER